MKQWQLKYFPCLDVEMLNRYDVTLSNNTWNTAWCKLELSSLPSFVSLVLWWWCYAYASFLQVALMVMHVTLWNLIIHYCCDVTIIMKVHEAGFKHTLLGLYLDWFWACLAQRYAVAMPVYPTLPTRYDCTQQIEQCGTCHNKDLWASELMAN